MKTAITVDLGDASYSLDQDAFLDLHAYLDRAATRLGDHPDRDEVLTGLERSIGVKLARAGTRPAPFTRAEIAAALKEVGRVDGPLLGPSREESLQPRFRDDGPEVAPRDDRAWPRPRRLYRLDGDKKIAGVCAGLAAYLNLDVGLVRAIVLLAAVFTGFFVVIAGYIALTFLVPVARTSTEIAAARGALRSA